MQKSIPPLHLIIGGLVAHFIGFFFSYNVFAQGLGVIGDICFLIGLITGIVELIKKSKKGSQ
jgi:uncharacterized membrane protein YedE/YeeE